jgi:hypothetical protein
MASCQCCCGLTGNRTYLVATHVVTIAQIKISSESILMDVVRCGVVMDTNQRQIALSLFESLRSDLLYAHLKNGRRVLDVADLRQYLYEQMTDIRTSAFVMNGLHGSDSVPERDNKVNGHNGKTHFSE